MGVLRELAGKNAVSFEFDEHVVVKDVIRRMTDSFSPKFKQALIDIELNDPRPNVLVFLNKTEIGVMRGLETEVKNGDKLVLIPVSHGG